MKFLRIVTYYVMPFIFSGAAMAASSSQIQCVGVEFDIKSSDAPISVSLKAKESEDYISFEGRSKTAIFNVNIHKETLSVFSTIDLKDSTTLQTKGSFNSSGVYETVSMKGGNIMMPESSISISCLKQ